MWEPPSCRWPGGYRFHVGEGSPRRERSWLGSCDKGEIPSWQPPGHTARTPCTAGVRRGHVAVGWPQRTPPSCSRGASGATWAGTRAEPLPQDARALGDSREPCPEDSEPRGSVGTRGPVLWAPGFPLRCGKVTSSPAQVGPAPSGQSRMTPTPTGEAPSCRSATQVSLPCPLQVSPAREEKGALETEYSLLSPCLWLRHPSPLPASLLAQTRPPSLATFCPSCTPPCAPRAQGRVGFPLCPRARGLWGQPGQAWGHHSCVIWGKRLTPPSISLRLKNRPGRAEWAEQDRTGAPGDAVLLDRSLHRSLANTRARRVQGGAQVGAAEPGL